MWTGGLDSITVNCPEELNAQPLLPHIVVRVPGVVPVMWRASQDRLNVYSLSGTGSMPLGVAVVTH
jgi:hypothetical protein